MRNSDYWKQRFTQLEEAQHNRSEQLADDIKRIFEETQKSLEMQIELWLRRLADNNGVSMSEARKMLDKNELKEFRWNVYEYIRHGEENALNQQWIKQLENASAKVHISRLEALKINTRQQLEVLFSKYSETVQTAMKETYVDEQLHTAYEIQKGIGIGFNVSMPNEKLLDKVIAKPWVSDGFNFSERIWNNKNKLISEVHSQLTQNILTGRDPQHAIDAIAKKMNTSKYNAGRLVMTESAYFSSLARGDCYEYLKVEEYQILATLDIKTSEICQNLDGKIFSMKDYQSGVTAPPFHVWCRSTTVPYDEDFGAFGERIARDPQTGKTYYVPADMTYPEWHEKFVANGDKSDLKPIDKSGGSGIIKESGKKAITPITDKAIERVPNAKIQGYSDKQCEIIQNQHKELLKYSRDNNENKEVAFVFDNEFKNRKEFKGSDDKLEFGNVLYGKDLFVMHNHPRNSSFSDYDIQFFTTNDNVKSLSIVKNNGSVEVISKTSSFTINEMKTAYKRAFKKYVKQGTNEEIDKAIEYMLKKNGGILEWIR